MVNGLTRGESKTVGRLLGVVPMNEKPSMRGLPFQPRSARRHLQPETTGLLPRELQPRFQIGGTNAKNVTRVIGAHTATRIRQPPATGITTRRPTKQTRMIRTAPLAQIVFVLVGSATPNTVAKRQQRSGKFLPLRQQERNLWRSQHSLLSLLAAHNVLDHARCKFVLLPTLPPSLHKKTHTSCSALVLTPG